MTGALRQYEDEHPVNCALLQSEDEFYGFSRGSNRLQKFVEWVYVPAVKNVTEEQQEARDNALGRLVARAVRSKITFSAEIEAIREEAKAKYTQLVNSQKSALTDLQNSLQARVTQWAHPGAKIALEWALDDNKSISVQEPIVRSLAGDGHFVGEIARLGHGLQRSYLLALLHELASNSPERDQSFSSPARNLNSISILHRRGTSRPCFST